MVKTRKSVKVTKNAKTKMKAGITAPKSGIVKEEEGLDDEQVSCWDDTLAAGSIPRLLQDAKTLWDLYGGGGSQSAKTFWIGRKKKPRCLLEATALQIAESHMEGDAFRGVEFWTRWHGSDEEVDKKLNEFHTDHDVVAFHSKGLWTHPAVATATYLTSIGAPLVICQIENEDGDKEGVSCPAVCICFPAAGRHVAFEGSLLHGVPANKEILGVKSHECRRGHQPMTGRMSFLVNIWLDHTPHSCKQLTSQDLRKLDKGRGVFELKPKAEETPYLVLDPAAKGRRIRKLVLVDGLAVPIPLDQLRRAASKTHPPVLRLHYKKGQCVAWNRAARRSR